MTQEEIDLIKAARLQGYEMGLRDAADAIANVVVSLDKSPTARNHMIKVLRGLRSKIKKVVDDQTR